MTPALQTPNLQTIADIAGVSRAAVSLALRNMPGISVETKERIKKIADECGYRPNPMVSALMAHLKGVTPSQDVGAIPFLTAHSTKDGWRTYSTFMRYYAGARDRAQQLGYRLDEIWLREPGMTAKRMSSILINRGIQGLLIGPLPRGLGHVSINLSAFSVATVGHSLVRPKVHRAACHQLSSLRTAIQEVRRLGYRRIALATSEMQDQRNDFNWTTGYAGYELWLPKQDRIPILFLDKITDADFAKWIKHWKPDAILSGNLKILEYLEKAGLSVPNDVGLALLDRSPENTNVAGIDQQFEAVGAAAIDLIISQINRNERGASVIPKMILTEGLWVPGKTLSHRQERKSKSAAKGIPKKRALMVNAKGEQVPTADHT